MQNASTLLLAVAGALLWHTPVSAEWKLVDQGACEGVIVSLSDGLEPLRENCTPAMAGKAALCYTEVCKPHCLYFDFPLEQCQHGADMGKRFVCVPD
jgi:hypothetical protein